MTIIKKLQEIMKFGLLILVLPIYSFLKQIQKLKRSKLFQIIQIYNYVINQRAFFLTKNYMFLEERVYMTNTYFLMVLFLIPLVINGQKWNSKILIALSKVVVIRCFLLLLMLRNCISSMKTLHVMKYLIQKL